MKQMTKLKENRRFAVGALALSIVLGVPLTVYAGYKEASTHRRARNGAEVATACTALAKRQGQSGNPRWMVGCIVGSCDILHPKSKDPVGFRGCMANANRKLKE